METIIVFGLAFGGLALIAAIAAYRLLRGPEGVFRSSEPPERRD